ncbi:MAG: PD40 domain-containing protein [Labilithrix sp.]|nr:PD40 domain-containing protein [Labilithrix sp.]
MRLRTFSTGMGLVVTSALAAVAFGVACSDDPAAKPADGGGADGAADASGGDDAGSGRCDPKKPFGAPVRVPAPVDSNVLDFDARLSPDELTMVFASGRPTPTGGRQIFMATRADTEGEFGDVVELAPLSRDDLASPSLSADELEIVISQARALDPEEHDVLLSVRGDLAAEFDVPRAVGALASDAGLERWPFMLASAKAIYLSVSPRGASTSYDIHRAARSGATVSAPAIVESLSSPGDDVSVFVSEDELTAYFASDRASPRQFDIYVGRRASTSAPFTVAPVTELNTAESERPSFVTADDCVMYLSRTAGAFEQDGEAIYRAVRPK